LSDRGGQATAEIFAFEAAFGILLLRLMAIFAPVPAGHASQFRKNENLLQELSCSSPQKSFSKFSSFRSHLKRLVLLITHCRVRILSAVRVFLPHIVVFGFVCCRPLFAVITSYCTKLAI
jgi:hypothetical protein